MANRISVVVSQGQSENPAKRNLEESLITNLMMEPGIDVTVVPHLYDLKPDGTGMLALKGLSGNIVVLSWLFERAAHWTLDRNGIHGQVGQVELKNEAEDQSDPEEDPEADSKTETKERLVDSRVKPNRHIYCLDLRVSNKADDFISEVRRIQKERSVKIVPLGIGNAAPNQDTASSPTDEQLQRYENPTNDTALPLNGNGLQDNPISATNQDQPAMVYRVEEQGGRRWYPVIDYSRCTNCMECIDFCLFGVYGVDKVDSILVEQPDNCRKGCPACSRVCPENAIIFPQHKTPAIAGSPEVGASLKIDLSKLFGAPDDGKSAEEIAALERDEQLMAVGREAVGMKAEPTKRRSNAKPQERDELDSLVDELDDLDL